MMEEFQFQYTPTDGFRNTSEFPDPANGGETREQFQGMMDQPKDFINTNFKFTRDLSTNGYLKFPGGLIIEWGTITLSSVANGSTASQAISYPIAFPTAMLTIDVCVTDILGVSPGDVVTNCSGGTSKTSFTAYAKNNGGGTASSITIKWFALGY